VLCHSLTMGDSRAADPGRIAGVLGLLRQASPGRLSEPGHAGNGVAALDSATRDWLGSRARRRPVVPTEACSPS
jgi:hypothetical protein